MIDEDEELYWSRMQSNVSNIDDDINEDLHDQTTVTSVIYNDDEYYNTMIDASENNSIVLPENHVIWQSIIRSNASMKNTGNNLSKYFHLISNCNEAALNVIKQWLFTYLPFTSVMYGLLCYMMKDINDVSNINLFVDHPSQPTMMMAISRIDNQMNISIFSSNDIIESTYISLVELILKLHDEYRLNTLMPLHFIGVDWRIIDKLTWHLNSAGYLLLSTNVCDLNICERTPLHSSCLSIEYSLPWQYEYVKLTYVISACIYCLYMHVSIDSILTLLFVAREAVLLFYSHYLKP